MVSLFLGSTTNHQAHRVVAVGRLDARVVEEGIPCGEQRGVPLCRVERRTDPSCSRRRSRSTDGHKQRCRHGRSSESPRWKAGGESWSHCGHGRGKGRLDRCALSNWRVRMRPLLVVKEVVEGAVEGQRLRVGMDAGEAPALEHVPVTVGPAL